MNLDTDKRAVIRVKTNTDVNYSFDQHRWLVGRIKDISNSGIFINTIDKFRVEDKIYLQFVLPGMESKAVLRITGKVVRTIPDNIVDSPTGLGILFQAVISEREDILTDFIINILDDDSLIERVEKEGAVDKKLFCLDLERVAKQAKAGTEEGRKGYRKKAEKRQKRERMVKKTGKIIYHMWKYLLGALLVYAVLQFILLLKF